MGCFSRNSQIVMFRPIQILIRQGLSLTEGLPLVIVLMCGATWLHGEVRNNHLLQEVVQRQNSEQWLMECVKEYGLQRFTMN